MQRKNYANSKHWEKIQNKDSFRERAQIYSFTNSHEKEKNVQTSNVFKRVRDSSNCKVEHLLVGLKSLNKEIIGIASCSDNRQTWRHQWCKATTTATQQKKEKTTNEQTERTKKNVTGRHCMSRGSGIDVDYVWAKHVNPFSSEI